MLSPETSGFDLSLGSTHVLTAEQLQEIGTTGNKHEQSLGNFFRVLSTDPNIKAVSIARITGGGIYSHFFVGDLLNQEAMIRTLEVTDNSLDFLEEAAGDKAFYHGFINVGGRPFEEVENRYRSRAHEGLELVGIVRFQ